MSLYIVHIYTKIDDHIEDINTFNAKSILHIEKLRESRAIYIDTYFSYNIYDIELTDQKTFTLDQVEQLTNYLNTLQTKNYKFLDYYNQIKEWL